MERSRLDRQAEWLKYARESYAVLIRRHLRAGDRVLKTDSFRELRGADVVDALSERFRSVVVADIAMSALRRSSDLRGGQGRAWIQTSVQSQPFADASFDAVVSFSTLDHFRSPLEIATSTHELARLTKPGGRMLITLDDGGNPLLALRDFLPNRLLQTIGLAPYECGITLAPSPFSCRPTVAQPAP